MTVSSTTNRISYTGDGSNKTFAFTFKIYEASDLYVYVNGILHYINTDYTIAGIMPLTSGNVVFTDLHGAPGAGTMVTLIRRLPITQLTDYVEGDLFSAETHENALDRLIMILQQIIPSALPVYTTNAAAIVGGLVPGDIYKTGADPDVVCCVH